MYEIFEHTADVGLRVRWADLPGLFAEAGRGLASIAVANLDDVKPVQVREISVAGEDREYLLFDWLTELLYIFDTEHLLLVDFDVKIDESGLSATCRGEPIDGERHRLEHEVKAITYHGLKVEQTDDGWQAEVIVDI
ncbi:MAG: archease [Planctomycetes bacterium]|nr:archease [Planctomycetota bacterium]